MEQSGRAWLKRVHDLLLADREMEALDAYLHFLEFEPENADAWSNLGRLLISMDRLEEAAEALEKALSINSGHAEARIDLGVIQMKQGSIWEAEGQFRRVLAGDPRRINVRMHLAECLIRKGDLEDARRQLERILQLQPDHTWASDKLLSLHCHTGDLEALEAEADRRLSTVLDSTELILEHGLQALKRGDLLQGWAQLEAYRTQGSHQLPVGPFAEPLWRGEPFPGKTLLLHWERGFGDTLMFIRYASMAKALGGRVVVVTQPALADLAATCPGVDQVVAHGDPLPPFDWQLPLLSLPWVFKTDMGSIPADIPYLDVPARVPNRKWLAKALAASVGRTRIGYAWSSNTGHARLQNRAIAPELLQPLADLRGIAWHCFQVPAVEVPPIPSVPLAPLLSNFSDTAYALSGMDLVITVDTALAHVAGALGIPTLLMVQYWCDWRWFSHRPDSPWYPTFRLYRQPRPGDWESVIQDLLRDLAVGT